MSAVAFVLTDRPLPVTVSTDPDPSLGEGLARSTFRLGERVIGRAVCSEFLGKLIETSDLLSELRLIGLFVEEREDGIHGTLMLLIPTEEFAKVRDDVLQADDEADLTEVLLHYPPGTLRDAEEFPFDMIGLGRIVRPAKMRNHVTNLTNEATDMLARLLFDQGYHSKEQKAIDDLLSSI